MITLTREEAQQVLDVLAPTYKMDLKDPQFRAVKILCTALAQPEPSVEPVAWRHTFNGDVQLNNLSPLYYGHHWKSEPLYTAPPQREWQGLTDEEIRRTDHHRVDGAYDYSFKQGAQWAEAKLREKNCASNIRNKPRPK